MKNFFRAWLREHPLARAWAFRLCQVGMIVLGGYIAFRLVSIVKVGFSIFSLHTWLERDPSSDLLNVVLFVLGIGILSITIRAYEKRKRRKIPVKHAR